MGDTHFLQTCYLLLNRNAPLMPEYKKIYLQKYNTYWNELASDLNSNSEKTGIRYTNYFYHEKLVKEKKIAAVF